MKTSPTQRSLALARKQGYTCQVVERWNSFAKVRQDLFGFIDIVCVHPMEDIKGVVGIQTTTRANMLARIQKIQAEQKAVHWLNAGGKITVHGWSKKGKRGEVKRWVVDWCFLGLDGNNHIVILEQGGEHEAGQNKSKSL